MIKNEEVEVLIEDMGASGEGVGKVDGYTLFVKDAVIGDLAKVKVMKAKKNYGYARLMKLIQPSKDRVEPICPSARQCGGCQIQSISYEKQLEFKQNKIKNHLERIGGFHGIKMEPMIGMEEPFYYRNKAQFPIGKNKNGEIIAGFYAGHTHTIIPMERCYLGVKENEVVLEKVLSFMKEYRIEPYDEEHHRGLIRHVLIRYGFTTKEIMVCLIINGKTIPHVDALISSLQEISGMTSITMSVNKKQTNVIMGEEIKVLWGQGYIQDYIGDLVYQISPLSFYQVNPVQTKRMYDTVKTFAGLTGNEVVWDLYCGIGTISLYLAKSAKEVYGVEVIPQAIEDARHNATLNGIENGKFYVGKAEEVLPELYEKEGIFADVIVVDPPRKGCEETLLQTIVEMKPKKVVYVSCDSATLARDLKYLCAKGFEVEKVQGFDNFSQTVHVETVVLLEQKGQ